MKELSMRGEHRGRKGIKEQRQKRLRAGQLSVNQVTGSTNPATSRISRSLGLSEEARGSKEFLFSEDWLTTCWRQRCGQEAGQGMAAGVRGHLERRDRTETSSEAADGNKAL